MPHTTHGDLPTGSSADWLAPPPKPPRRTAGVPMIEFLIVDQAGGDPARCRQTLHSLQSLQHRYWQATVITPADREPPAPHSWPTAPADDPRWRWWTTDCHPERALSMLLQGGRSPWLAVLNAGDRLAPNTISLLADVLPTSADVIGCDYLEADPQGGWSEQLAPLPSGVCLMQELKLSPLHFLRRQAVLKQGGWPAVGLAKAQCHLLSRLSRRDGAWGRLPHVLCQSTGRLQDKTDHASTRLETRVTSVKRWPRMAVVLVAHDQTSKLVRQVENIIDNTKYPNRELVLAQPADLKASARKQLDDWHRAGVAQVVSMPKGTSPCEMHNRAAQASQGEVLIFLEPSVRVLQRDWMQRLARRFEDSRVGLVGGTIITADHRVAEAGWSLSSKAQGIALFAGQPTRSQHKKASDAWNLLGRVTDTRECLTHGGLARAFRRSAWDAVHGCWTSLGPQNAKLVLGLAVRQAGWAVVHDGSISWTSTDDLFAHQHVRREKLSKVEACQGTVLLHAWASSGDPFVHPRLEFTSAGPRIRKADTIPIEINTLPLSHHEERHLVPFLDNAA